jgi:hypothetical protein
MSLSHVQVLANDQIVLHLHERYRVSTAPMSQRLTSGSLQLGGD